MKQVEIDQMIRDAKAILATQESQMELQTATRVNCQMTHPEPAQTPGLKIRGVKAEELATSQGKS